MYLAPVFLRGKVSHKKMNTAPFGVLIQAQSAGIRLQNFITYLRESLFFSLKGPTFQRDTLKGYWPVRQDLAKPQLITQTATDKYNNTGNYPS